MGLPNEFCWTKYGTEAGETTTSILARKEAERCADDGVFLWGIGSSIRPSLSLLLDQTPEPEVVFTPMLSSPAVCDVEPSAVGVWRSAVDLFGNEYALPTHSAVTSGSRTGEPPRRHFALVCHREVPLVADGSDWLDDSGLRNIRTGSQVGSSQVTAVVKRVGPGSAEEGRYRVAFRASLVAPHMVVLSNWESV